MPNEPCPPCREKAPSVSDAWDALVDEHKTISEPPAAKWLQRRIWRLTQATARSFRWLGRSLRWALREWWAHAVAVSIGAAVIHLLHWLGVLKGHR